MLVSLENVVPNAYIHHYAVGAFNVVNIETTQAVIGAAEELKSPVIVQTSEKALNYAGFENLTSVVLGMAKKSSVPVVVHLDHGRSFQIAKKCLEVGYSSVMLDLSDQSYENNLSKTKELVIVAKKYGASVESELGAILGAEDDVESSTKHFTDPNKAREFIKATGINALAVAIGNAHGPNAEAEHLDFKLLEQIQEMTHFPLVLHGASGDKELIIKTAIRLGVVKINIDTELRQTFTLALRTFLRSNLAVYDPREVLTIAKEAMCEKVKEKIHLFGSVGKA